MRELNSKEYEDVSGGCFCHGNLPEIDPEALKAAREQVTAGLKDLRDRLVSWLESL